MRRAAYLMVGVLLLAGCSWQAAAIGVPVAGLALFGPPVVTGQMYTQERMAGLRQRCVESGGASVDDSLECHIYFTEMRTCLGHLGLVAAEGWRKRCEGESQVTIKFQPNFRGVMEYLVMQVYEGMGTAEDPGRIVYYVYTKDAHLIGVLDEHEKLTVQGI